MYDGLEIATIMTHEEECAYAISPSNYPDKSKFQIFALLNDQNPVRLTPTTYTKDQPILWSNHGQLHLLHPEKVSGVALYNLEGDYIKTLDPEQISLISLPEGTYIVRLILQDNSNLIQKIIHLKQ